MDTGLYPLTRVKINQLYVAYLKNMDFRYFHPPQIHPLPRSGPIWQEILEGQTIGSHQECSFGFSNAVGSNC